MFNLNFFKMANSIFRFIKVKATVWTEIIRVKCCPFNQFSNNVANGYHTAICTAL